MFKQALGKLTALGTGNPSQPTSPTTMQPPAEALSEQQQQQQQQPEQLLAADPDIMQEGLALAHLLVASNNAVNGKDAAGSVAPTLAALAARSDAAPSRPFRHVPLAVEGNTYQATAETAQLLQEIGGPKVIRALTERFYRKAFVDASLDKFIIDPADPHGERLANWIVEKMGGYGPVWSTERAQRCPVARILSSGASHTVRDRTSAHVAAWWSPKRPAHEAGEHFKLHDARVWMRLMFWSAREEGLFTLSPTFESWYIRFIAHFVRVYERTAPAFARESSRWSTDSANILAYKAAGCSMGPNVLGTDGQGVSLAKALTQLPAGEVAEARTWPYED